MLTDILEGKETLQHVEQERIAEFTKVNGTDILQQFYDQGINSCYVFLYKNIAYSVFW